MADEKVLIEIEVDNRTGSKRFKHRQNARNSKNLRKARKELAATGGKNTKLNTKNKLLN